MRPSALHTAFLLSLLVVGGYSPTKAAGPVLGEIDDFTLPSTTDEIVSLPVDAQFTVICFLGTECPLARIYGPKLSKMSSEYHDRDIRFIGINSNIQDSMQELRDFAESHDIAFPIGKDYDRSVALKLNATRTPEVMIVDRLGRVRYRGRIDDQYQPGIARSKATQHDLRNALDQLIAGQEVKVSRTTAVGCLIALPKQKTTKVKSTVTYANQVSRILQKHCVECHRQGEIGPFALDDYDEILGWSDMMVEVIEQQRMPPWHANPEHGTFANARHMSDADKETIRHWVEAGSPFGDAKDLPPLKTYESGWRLPKEPDLVLKMSRNACEIPANGVVEYQYFVVDPGFSEDKWIRAAQVIPGNSSVVHHCIAFIRPPDGSDFSGFGMLAGYVPGQLSTTLPEGYAQRVPAGARLVFQMHYTPNGKPTSDQTKIGMVFADAETVTHEVFALVGINQEFEIPPQISEHRVKGELDRFPRNGQLLAIAPHMHLRGKAFRMTASFQSGDKTLLDVPHYDFNWQHNYELIEPLELSDIDQLKYEATFDNSAANPTNPDPNEYVTWGDQTWQEMAVTFVTVAKPLKSETPEDGKPEQTAEQIAQLEAKVKIWNEKADAFADSYMKRFDRNQDGQISYREIPPSVRMCAYFDHNHDGVISREEIRNESYWRQQRSR